VRKIRPRLKRRLAAGGATTFLVATRGGHGMLGQRGDHAKTLQKTVREPRAKNSEEPP